MIATDSGHPIRPPDLDEAFSAQGIYQPEGGGLFDLLPNDALDRLYPGRYRSAALAGFAGPAIKAAVPSPDTYVILFISTRSVPGHFVIAYSADGSLIADPWTGAVGRLSAYGGPVAVQRTILVKALPPSSAPPHPSPPVVAPKPAPPPNEAFPGVLQTILILLLRALLNLKGQTQP